MRILILHSRYLSGSVSGENRVVEDETRLLREGGHEVDLWTPAPENRGILDLARAGVGAVWSARATRETRRRIGLFRPGVMHCHNLIPALSPGVLRVAREMGIPTVMTLHNYRSMCLPGTFLRDGHVCEDCLGHHPWRGIVHRCHRDSVAASSAVAASISLHRVIGTAPSLFLAVSDFLRRKHVEAGIPPNRIIVKHNFAWPNEARRGPGRYFLYLGRLDREKGVALLLDAWASIDAELWVVGDGSQASELKAAAPANVRFVGPLPAAEAERTVAEARALLVPSEWYEGQPRSVLEAFAAGVPVVASRIGGLPELIEEGSNGLLIDPHDVAGWREAIRRLLGDREATRMGDGALRSWEKRFSPSTALAALERVYASVAPAGAMRSVP